MGRAHMMIRWSRSSMSAAQKVILALTLLALVAFDATAELESLNDQVSLDVSGSDAKSLTSWPSKVPKVGMAQVHDGGDDKAPTLGKAEASIKTLDQVVGLGEGRRGGSAGAGKLADCSLMYAKKVAALEKKLVAMEQQLKNKGRGCKPKGPEGSRTQGPLKKDGTSSKGAVAKAKAASVAAQKAAGVPSPPPKAAVGKAKAKAAAKAAVGKAEPKSTAAGIGSKGDKLT